MTLNEILEAHDCSKDGDANSENDDWPIFDLYPNGTICELIQSNFQIHLCQSWTGRLGLWAQLVKVTIVPIIKLSRVRLPLCLNGHYSKMQNYAGMVAFSTNLTSFTYFYSFVKWLLNLTTKIQVKHILLNCHPDIWRSCRGWPEWWGTRWTCRSLRKGKWRDQGLAPTKPMQLKPYFLSNNFSV